MAEASGGTPLERAATLLRSRQIEDRLRAVRLAERDASPEAQQILLAALEDRTNYVAALAAKALAECADWPVLAKMRARFDHLMEDGLKRDAGCHIRAELAFAFGRREYLPADDSLRAGI